MFKGLTVRGVRGSVMWSYADAAALGSWSIRKNVDNPDWTLTATVARFDAFRVRQRPLRFIAPRAGGFWCWPVVGQVQIDGSQLIARIGPPEY